MKRTIRVVLALALTGAVLASTGCFAFREVDIDETPIRVTGLNEAGDINNATHTPLEMGLKGAKTADVKLTMGAGEMVVYGLSAEPTGSAAASGSAVPTATATGYPGGQFPKADTLMLAEFIYAGRWTMPEVGYDIAGTHGSLDVKQHDDGARSWRGYKGNSAYKWEIALARSVPVNVRIEMGAGKGDVVLSDTQLQRLDVLLGAGDMTLDLSGPWDHNVTADIEAGVGKLTLYVPKDVGVRVEGRVDGIGTYKADGMISRDNAYENAAYGKTPYSLDIQLRRGVGDVTIQMVD